MDFDDTLTISAFGMKAQSQRMRVIAENIANADSVANSPDENPYRRKLVTFRNALDREMGVNLVKVDKVKFDESDFGKKFDPTHPAADDKGYIKTTNVRTIVETMDMRQAQRTYQANVNTIESVRAMATQTLELLR